MARKKSKASDNDSTYERIWWLLERDLLCWASVMVGYRDGKHKIWAHYQDVRDEYFHRRPKMRVYEFESDRQTSIEVEKISEADLLAWWRDVVLRADCTWDEAEARARFVHLTLLEPALELLRLQIKEMGRQLGRAAPLWVQMAMEQHGCPRCRDEDARLAASSTIHDVFNAELEQARARVRMLEAMRKS